MKTLTPLGAALHRQFAAEALRQPHQYDTLEARDYPDGTVVLSRSGYAFQRQGKGWAMAGDPCGPDIMDALSQDGGPYEIIYVPKVGDPRFRD